MSGQPPKQDFFKKRQRALRSNLIDITSEGASTSSTAPPSKKKYAKHRSTNGFTQQNIDEQMSKLKQTKHAWRRVQPVIDIAYTTVIQKFEFQGKSIERFHFCPWGMHGSFMDKMSAIWVKSSYLSLQNTEILVIIQRNHLFMCSVSIVRLRQFQKCLTTQISVTVVNVKIFFWPGMSLKSLSY